MKPLYIIFTNDIVKLAQVKYREIKTRDITQYLTVSS